MYLQCILDILRIYKKLRIIARARMVLVVRAGVIRAKAPTLARAPTFTMGHISIMGSDGNLRHTWILGPITSSFAAATDMQIADLLGQS